MDVEVGARSLALKEPPARFGSSSFVENVLNLLDQTEYRRCETGEDLEAIYQLRYKSYRSVGMVGESLQRSIFDRLDETPNVSRFGIFVAGRLLSTIRIHHLTKQHPWSASMLAFDDIVSPMLDEGQSFVCLSRFASDPEWVRNYPQLVYVTLRLAGMACLYFDAPYGLSTVQEHHAAFYRRVYGSDCIGPPRDFPGLQGNKVVLFRTDAHSDKEAFFRRYPFFRSTASERRMLFSPRKPRELPPLTVLPTVRYVRAA